MTKRGMARTIRAARQGIVQSSQNWPLPSRTGQSRGDQLSSSTPNRESKSPQPLTVDLALLAVAVMWASTFTLFKVAWREIDPVAFTALRFGVMVLCSIAVLMLAKSRVRPARADVPLLIASGLTGYFLYQMGFVLGLDRTSALASAILISTHPLFSVMALWALRREKPQRIE